ncbi:aspartate aminotransferase family protein [Pseudomonas sp. S75]|uniref:DOPA decarboxylase n=1 Tax=unclassified Pseudomonas TaxID=196821 RepID=UPI0019078B83|nr:MULTISPECIES: DOPA decarboxylase [unclassified Pseudomonas]MBJ9973962.1 aspartate aminotransferase family protein [Pseudomonas sp. S30]MBK0152108.1 aspartate aminotransferase family protein [Pseudomonas sp. S75]
MTPEQFRQYGRQLIDLIADYRQDVAQRPVMAQVEPGYLKALLPEQAPLQGEPFEAILDDVTRHVMPGLSHWQHPDFYGYFPSNGTLSSVLGDMLSTGLGVLGLSWQSSPALSELEEVTLDWLRQSLGLSSQWSGVIQDTASTSTLVALISARERSSDYALARGGLQGQSRPLVVYVSAQAHSSVDKAALLAGFGRDNIRQIPTDEDFALRPEALRAAIEQDLAEGRQPCAVVATTGTTATTALDPLRAIGEITQAAGLWLHVDSAMAGSAMILPECRWMWEGIELADSLVVNAHKWLGVAFDCSLYYVRDTQHLIRVMSTNPSYLQSSVDGEVKNLRDWGIPLGRRFRALKLWFMLRSEGLEALQQRLRRDLDNARWLAAQVQATPDWEVLAPVQLQTLCLRHRPSALDADALDAHTRAWAERLNASGKAYVTPATLQGRWMVRVSIGALPTQRADVERLWANLQAAVRG